MMAHVDGLTGVPNRRRLDEYLQAVWSNCREQSKPLSLLAIDVDHFKQYNDRRGHLAGDELLKDLVRECLGCLRRTEDLLARYGGEEFVVVLPGADVGVARTLAESMRAAVANSAMGVTVSIGVSSALPDDAALPTELFTRADEALYAAKRAGRNRVCVWGEAGQAST
jgi:diguanylate cyclase (GGDEF)-like protein